MTQYPKDWEMQGAALDKTAARHLAEKGYLL